jgi:hypothetical protein
MATTPQRVQHFKNQEIIATNLSFTIIPKLEDFILENEWKSTISRYIFQG